MSFPLLVPCSPHVAQKVETFEGSVRDIMRMLRETRADQDAVRWDLEEVKEKCRHSHIIAGSEKERMKEKERELNERLDSSRYREEESDGVYVLITIVCRQELKTAYELGEALSSNLKESDHQLFHLEKRTKNLSM